MAADILAILLKTNLAAAAAVLLVLAVRKPARRAFGARVSYALWLVAPLAVGASLLPPRVVVLSSFVTTSPAGVASAPVLTSPLIAPVALTAPYMDSDALLIALWLAGVAISLGLLAWSQSRFMKSLGGVVREGRFLRAGASGPGPAVVGALFPKIVLPSDFETRYDAGEQKVVLAHEAAHLASGDAIVNAAIALSQCLFWFNPLIHRAARIVRVDQELACDAAVLSAHPQMRRPYAEALLKTQIAATPLPLGCYWPAGASNPLKERIAMLKLETPSRARRLFGGGAVLTLCLGAGLAAWAAQPAAVTLAPANVVVPVEPAAAAAPVQARTSVVASAAIAANEKAAHVADNQPVSLTQTVVTDSGRTFQRVNAPPTTVSLTAGGTLTVITADGRRKTFIVPRPPLSPPASLRPAGWKPVPLEPLAETEDVRTAKAAIATAIMEQDARVAAGKPPQPLTSELSAALTIVPKFYRESLQRKMEINRLERRQSRELALAYFDDAIAREANNPVERQKYIDGRERYIRQIIASD